MIYSNFQALRFKKKNKKPLIFLGQQSFFYNYMRAFLLKLFLYCRLLIKICQIHKQLNACNIKRSYKHVWTSLLVKISELRGKDDKKLRHVEINGVITKHISALVHVTHQ